MSLVLFGEGASIAIRDAVSLGRSHAYTGSRFIPESAYSAVVPWSGICPISVDARR